ncbi:MAG: hypothetical protein H7X95_13565 [Deltaproteobacteria bacterium]|nr:hypothetical protein [Deltaproteobacteria bacterium]
MEKPDPTCPTCHKPAKFLRDINSVVEFWECEATHMFVVDKKPPPKITAAAAAAAAAAATAAAVADPDTEPKAP